MRDIVIVRGDDWDGLFADGELLLEGHSLDARQVLEALGIPVRSLIVNEEWMESMGRFPERLEEVEFD